MAAAEMEADGPAVRALGALFTVSQVFLWDDAKVSDDLEVSDRIGSLEEEEEEGFTRSNITCDANISIEQAPDYCSSMEDLELAHHMAALGLPVSFSTTKQRKVATSGKRKGMLVKSKFAHEDTEDQEPGISKVEEKNYSFPKVLHDSTNLPVSVKSTESEGVASNHDALEENTSGSVQFDAGFVCETAVTISEDRESEACDEMTTLEHVVDEFQTSGVDIDAENLDQNENIDAGSFSPDVLEDLSTGYCLELSNKQDSDNTSACWEFGDWRVIWDDYYRRYYFYNSKTQETTWYAPPGLEYLACSCSISTSNGLSADAVEQHSGFHFDCDDDRDQDANITQAESDPLQENKIVINQTSESDPLQENKNVINQTSSDSSAKTNYVNCLCTNVGSDSLDMITNTEEVSDNLFSCHPARINDNTIDELDIVAPLDKQDEKVTCHDALIVSDLSLGVAINNCLITSSNEVGYDGVGIEGSMMDELDGNHETATVNKKRRARRPQSQLKLQGVLGDLSANIFKYWCQRYSLFSRYDSGIKTDEEGWFSVTPEAIARHHATRCCAGIVIDCFAGIGGNSIQFAMKSNHVIAIDIDPQKVEFAYHNSTIYGVNDKIDFIQGDFFKMAAHLKGDTVFLSPPWGGPDYAKVQTYDIRSMLKPHDGYLLFETARMIASRVVIFLPRNVDLNQLAELSLSVYPPWKVEVEKNILNGKFKAVTAYFSSTT